MLKVIATDVVISKGYDGAPALRFSEKGVRFRVGKKIYDTRAENNQRWINLSVKAFGQTSERIKKMQLKEGSFVNILGRLDEDVWEDSTTHEKKSATVIIVDEIALEQIKTKAVAGMLDKFGISGKTLIVTGERDEKVYLSGRNIPGVNVTEAAGVNVYDLVASGKCVITEAAVRKIEQMQEAE